MSPSCRTRLIVLGIILLFILVAANTYLIFYVQNTIRITTERYDTTVSTTHPEKVIQGPQGVQGSQGLSIIGPTGPQGVAGAPGKDTTPIVNNITTVENVPVPGLQGNTGAQGDPGTPAKQINLRCNGGEIQWQYTGDLGWQTLLKLGVTESCP